MWKSPCRQGSSEGVLNRTQMSDHTNVEVAAPELRRSSPKAWRDRRFFILLAKFDGLVNNASFTPQMGRQLIDCFWLQHNNASRVFERFSRVPTVSQVVVEIRSS